jgi:hypothetical protein
VGLLGRLFGKLSEFATSTQKPGGFNSPTRAPLKAATKKRKAGDLAGAIKELEAVYKYMNDHPKWYSSKNACLLPLYLAEAKRNKEAWTLLVEILKKSDRCDYDYVLNQMRLFLQLAGQPLEAVKYGVMAHAALLCDLALLLPDGVNVYTAEMEKEEIEKLLEKAMRPELIDAVYAVAKKHYANTSELDLGGISRDMNEALHRIQSR